jgi:hypothetical protein
MEVVKYGLKVRNKTYNKQRKAKNAPELSKWEDLFDSFTSD